MGITVSGHKLRINLTIPLPRKYRGGGVAVFRINNVQPEVLLGLRANKPGKGLWTFPGGGADDKEKLSATAVREFREETGVQLYGRYITRAGLFQVSNPFFEWNTLVVESTQSINPDKRFSKKIKPGEYRNLPEQYPGGEFLSLRWVPLFELDDFKLHCWVKDVVDFYLSGKMRPYKAKPPKGEVKNILIPKNVGRTKTAQCGTVGNLLFDMAETVLAETGRDRNKNSHSAYRIKNKFSAFQEALYGI
jgi:8-oxo-dGTP pyrophosphatase MutT (NUDIX family)